MGYAAMKFKRSSATVSEWGTSSGATVMDYNRPPIIEAVIELRLTKPVENRVIERAATSLQAEYPFRHPEQGREIKVDAATGKTEANLAWTGQKLTSLDGADNALLRPMSFISSRLGPYLGWDQFKDRSKRDWGLWRKAAGALDLSRIGLRYVNRIDVPSVPATPVRLEDYLNCYPHMPDERPLHSYTMQMTQSIPADNCMLTINSASVVPPVIGFYSFVLDIDVFREMEMPRRDDDVWELLEKMRDHKNRVFESCITDRSRALFNQ
jgi:uncharacterized protein (TIGR04255 family)